MGIYVKHPKADIGIAEQQVNRFQTPTGSLFIESVKEGFRLNPVPSAIRYLDFLSKGEAPNFETTKAGFSLWMILPFLLPIVFFYAKYTYLNLSITLYERFRCIMQIHYLEKSFVEKTKYKCPYPYLRSKEHTFNMKVWKVENLLCSFDKIDYETWLSDQNWRPKKINMDTVIQTESS